MKRPDETDEQWERRLLDNHARLWKFYSAVPRHHHMMYWDGLELFQVSIPTPRYARRASPPRR
jgi:hypothetical protein